MDFHADEENFVSRWSGFYIIQEMIYSLALFLIIWQPFLMFATKGGISGIDFLCLQIHGLNLCTLSDGCH